MLRKFRVRVEGKEYIVEVEEVGKSGHSKQIGQPLNRTAEQVSEGVTSSTERAEQKFEPAGREKTEKKTSGGSRLVSPMSGTILDVLTSRGDSVKKGDKLIVLEAMKMENTVLSEHDGVVKEITVSKGDNVDAGDVLVIFE